MPFIKGDDLRLEEEEDVDTIEDDINFNEFIYIYVLQIFFNMKYLYI